MRGLPSKLEPRPHIVLYDADCGFCRLAVRWLLRLDRRRCLRAVAIQGAEGRGLLSEVPEAQRVASAHLLSPDGALHSGGAAAAPLAELLPGGSIAARLFLRFPSKTDRAYRWVARHASSLADWVSAPTARLADPMTQARDRNRAPC